MREVEHSGDDIHVFVSANGLLETAFEEPANDVSDWFTYSFATDDLLPLQPWSGQRGEQVTFDSGGTEVERLPFSYHTRGLARYRIGTCDYPSIAVQTYYEMPDETTLVEFVYLIDLGVPLVIGYGGPGYYDPFRPTAIMEISE